VDFGFCCKCWAATMSVMDGNARVPHFVSRGSGVRPHDSSSPPTASTSSTSLPTVTDQHSTSLSDQQRSTALLGTTSAAAALGRPNPRVYEVWPQVGGRNRFLCWGHCVTGPRIDFWYSCCAWSFIIAPCGFYVVVCSKWLWMHVNPWMPVLTGLVFLSTIVLLLLTSCTDPGIIPRQTLQVAVAGLEQEVATATGAGTVPLDAIIAEPVQRLTPQQEALGYRWCDSCKVVRPPRASHCRDCDNCVLTFDHHCPFVNNCVGQRNYAFFSGFLYSTGCLGVAVFSGIGIYFYHVASGSGGDSVTALNGPVLYVLLVIIGAPTAILIFAVFGLSIFHAFLACRGRTTKELLTGRVTVGGRTLSTLRVPSLIHARDRVTYPMLLV